MYIYLKKFKLLSTLPDTYTKNVILSHLKVGFVELIFEILILNPYL